ncbi:hypothetical protein [Nocardia terpenica]|uniref:hypothetical protein n=1 Tax=Nocardia terpenica TaxID=455432 RepID=UPI0012E78EB2|nr:hypothetical protein [Nocardia terpenica]
MNRPEVALEDSGGAPVWISDRGLLTADPARAAPDPPRAPARPRGRAGARGGSGAALAGSAVSRPRSEIHTGAPPESSSATSGRFTSTIGGAGPPSGSR